VGGIGEQGVNLLGGTYIELVAAVPQPVGVVPRFAGVDAEQHVVGAAVPLTKVMGVAGGHEWQAEAAGNVDGSLSTETLDLQAVVLDFNVKVVTEQAREPLRQPAGGVALVPESEFAELA